MFDSDTMTKKDALRKYIRLLQCFKDTEDIFLEAYELLVKSYGKDFTEELKLKCLGKNKTDLHNLLISELGLENKTVDELAAEGAAIQNHIYDTRKINLMPGVEKLVSHMASHNIPMSIATASPESHVYQVTKYHENFFHYFDHIITAEHGVRSKPFPDVFLISAQRLQDNLNPKEFLVFEDTPIGVEAAMAAGMQVIMTPHHLIPKDQTLKATKVLKSLEDFIPEEFGLPPYEEDIKECED